MRLALTFFALSLMLTACGRRNEPQPLTGDVALQQKLTGQWRVSLDLSNNAYFKSSIVVSSSGKYICQFTNIGGKIMETGSIEGVWEIKNGFLIDTMTKHSNTNALLPKTSRARIVRFDDQELVVKYESEQHESERVESVFQKDGN